MFWRKQDFKSNIIKDEKIGLIKNGSSASFITNIVRLSNCTVVFAPREKDDKEFQNDYNGYKNESNIVNLDVYNLESRSADIEDYVFIHKDDYAEYLKFKGNSRKLNITEEKKQKIKDRYKELQNQRSVAKEFNLSLSVINRILNNKY